MLRIKDILPPHLTTNKEMDGENGRVVGFADALEFIYRVSDMYGETHKPLTDEAKKLLFYRIGDILDASDPESRRVIILARDILAESWSIKAYEQARENIIDADTGSRAPGYSENEVFQIKENLLSDFWHVATTIGTPYAISQVLRHFLFTNITVEKTGVIEATYGGAFNYDGVILYDGGLYLAAAYFDITATKPASLTDGQAKHIIKAVARGYRAEQLRLYEIHLI